MLKFKDAHLTYLAGKLFASRNLCGKSDPVTETEDGDEINMEEIKVKQICHYKAINYQSVINLLIVKILFVFEHLYLLSNSVLSDIVNMTNKCRICYSFFILLNC